MPKKRLPQTLYMLPISKIFFRSFSLFFPPFCFGLSFRHLHPTKSLKLWKKHSFTYVIRFVSFSQMLVFQCILLIIYICSFYWFGHSTCSNNWETSRGFNTYLAAISTINILKTNIHTIKPSMQLIIPDIHSAGCIFRVFRVIIEITIPINEHNGPQNMTSK